MNAKDLMVGDLVCYRGTNIRVTSLYDKGGSNEIGWGRLESTWANGYIIEPIPLTPEILEKNGFTQCEPQGYDLYAKDKNGTGIYNILWQGESYNYDLEIAAYVYPFGEFNKRNIKYVHQLQHALRLCGIEEKIIL